MTTSRKKPGVAFWATVTIVAMLVGYPLSYGPASWFVDPVNSPAWILQTYSFIYFPLRWLHSWGPQPIQNALEWYVRFWV